MKRSSGYVAALLATSAEGPESPLEESGFKGLQTWWGSPSCLNCSSPPGLAGQQPAVTTAGISPAQIAAYSVSKSRGAYAGISMEVR